MMVIYTTLVILVFLLILLNTKHMWSAYTARRNGKLPPRGKGTMFNVRHLLMEGEKELAVQLYCEIFNTAPGKARKDIEELQRSLKV
ncbi:MAG: hypothetical protein HY591_01125 [Candidatus Omnitrophica bacterium]|nr:hypothetical protein [Candidatus Omnitrophota bacterium]